MIDKRIYIAMLVTPTGLYLQHSTIFKEYILGFTDV